MTKRRPDYKPQKRRPTRTTGELSSHEEGLNGPMPETQGNEGNAGELELTHENARYSDLFTIMEIEDGHLADNPQNLPAIMLNRLIDLRLMAGVPLDESDMKFSTLIVAKTLMGAVDYFRQHYHLDLCSNPDFIAESRPLYRHQIAASVTADIQTRVDGILSEIGVEADDTEHGVFVRMLLPGSLSGIIMAYAANRRDANSIVEQLRQPDAQAELHKDMAHRAIQQVMNNMNDEDTLSILGVGMKRDTRIMRRVSENPARYRRRNSALFAELTKPEMAEFIDSELDKSAADWLAWAEEDNHLQSDYEMLSIDGGQKLDYTILPEGENVREYVETLCGNLPSAERPYVDLERLSVLEAVRSEFGKDTTYFVHGKPRSAVAGDDGQLINEAYIGLVIQYHDRNGNVKGEDVVAISPIAKKHAGYIVRHDYSENSTASWRDILARPKSEARDKGARPLKFTNIAGVNKFEAYTAKALELLTCPSDQFGSEHVLRRNRDGTYKMKNRKLQVSSVSDLLDLMP